MTEQSPDQPFQDEPLDRAGATPLVIILGVVGILSGLFLFCTGLWPVVGSQLSGFPQQQQTHPLAESQKDPVIRTITHVSCAISLLLGITLIVSSIGLFKLRAWAWKLSLGTVVALMIYSIISIVVGQMVVVPRMEPYVEEYLASEEFQRQMVKAPQEMERYMRLIFKWGGTAFQGCCCFPYQIMIIVGLLVPGTRKQFFPTGGEPTDFPPAPTEP
ncbi:MAG: hypothetical protein O7H41_19565 [Planctomycetota bacterium]|nr:hypothetical protein [Planctomycetota bacterium]